ncbi:hypothetical protein VB264_24435 [Arcicella aquatica]|uniref:Uncharacterized protein n=1 Tax=Arcicella aquatica TaxID=217141 RepID=A0ABU5QVX1_9BACT|nr:hypothetical protein [Arcicella aquatica]MEA5260969.1 hypothetical protein [Arcicella aquatica]
MKNHIATIFFLFSSLLTLSGVAFAKKYTDMAEANPAMLAFTASHIGEIEAFKNDPQKLAHIIRDMKI